MKDGASKMKRLTLTAALALALTWAGGALQARTWYVTVAGTGDAPTIHAALDSAVAGDSVLVGPGTYTVDTTTVIPPSVVLISETGPTDTIIEGPWLLLLDGIAMGSGSELNGFWVKPGTLDGVIPGSNSLVIGNIIEGGGFSLRVDQSCWIYRNLFVSGILDIQGAPSFIFNIVMPPVICPRNGLGGAQCNNFVGTLSGCEEILFDQSNFSMDPQFCSPETGDYRLMASSPCAPGNHPFGRECTLIGPLGVGCAPVPTKEMSWGAVKALYSDGENEQ